jgi:hypothetical protein
VVLTSQPTAEVELPVMSNNGAEGTASPSSLVFDASNWNSPQTVTVLGRDDAIVDGDQNYTVQVGAPISDDAVYAGLSAVFASLTNTDNDSAAVLVDPTAGLETTEAGGQATFTVRLSTQPSADVTIPVASNAPAEGITDMTSLTFTPGNWNVEQTVTITGQDDFVDDDDQGYTIVLSPASSGDGNFNGTDPADVAVTNLDDDTAGITVGAVSGDTTEAGGQATFTVVLDSEPTANVEIGLASSNTDEITVDAPSLTFMPGEWNTPKTVTLTGQDDLIDDGDQPVTITVGPVTSGDGKFSALDPADVSLNNIDDDTAAVNVALVGGDAQTSEDGDTAQFTVLLATEPTVDVLVDVASDNADEGQADTAQLTFTPMNWQTPQTVTVTGQDDNVVDGDIGYGIELTMNAASADEYLAVNPTGVGLTNLDTTIEALTITPLSIDFGSAVEGTVGATRTVTIENTGEADVEITGVPITDADASSFAIVNDSCTDLNLAFGEACSIELEFRPQEVGALDARLRIASALNDSPNFVDLAGRGLADEADLSIVIQPQVDFGELGRPFSYDILVVNFGPSDVVGATVASAIDLRLSGVTWSCTPSTASTCPANGTGDLDETVDIPAGGDVMFVVTGTLTDGQPEEITSSVSVTSPQTPPDPVGTNNVDEITVRTGLFADGFEENAGAF